MLGCVIRDIERKYSNPDAILAEALNTARKIFDQKRNDKNKACSVHAPEKDNWMLAIDAVHGNPFEGHTLKDALHQFKQIIGRQPLHASCDKRYRGVAKINPGDRGSHIREEEKEYEGQPLEMVCAAICYCTDLWLFEIR